MLGGSEGFRASGKDELEFVNSFKTGELVVEPGSTIFNEGSHNSHLLHASFRLAFRFKTLENGSRQILNYVLSGDMIGLQGTVIGEMQHVLNRKAMSDIAGWEVPEPDARPFI